MIRTETELRRAVDIPDDEDALARLTSFASSLDAGARRTRPRRQWALPLAAAVLVLAFVAGLGAFLAGGRDGGSPPAGGDGPLSAAQLRPTWAMRFDRVDGYTVRNASAMTQFARGTLATVRATDAARPEQGSITTTPCAKTEPCGKFPTTTPVPVTVHGDRGSFWPGSKVTADSLVASVYRQPWLAAQTSNEQQPQLVWQAGDTTVLVTGTFGFDPRTYDYDAAASKAIMLRLARAVTAGRHDDITAPLALRGLPKGLAPEAVNLLDGSACIGYGTGEGPYPGNATGSVLTACRVTSGRNAAATLRAARLGTDWSGRYSIGDLSDGTSVVIALDPRHATLFTKARLDRLAAESDYTPKVADRDTWLVVR